jgi:hypothetical protein
VPTTCAAKVKEVGERLTTGAVPVPVRLTVWVAELALSVMVTEPLRAPVAVGVKVTLIEQEAPAATLEPQVLIWEKSPLAVMLEIVRAALPLFVSAIVAGELVVPTTWLPKLYDDGERATKGILGTLYSVTKAS